MCSTKSYKDESALIVVGGGIAGTSCVQILAHYFPKKCIYFIVGKTAKIKMAENVLRLGQFMEKFDVKEVNANCWKPSTDNVQVISKDVISMNGKCKTLTLNDETILHYEKLCICSGARPRTIDCLFHCDDFISQHVLTLRDDHTLDVFQNRLHNCRRALILGNGGIASELVHTVQQCDLIWAIKDKTIATPFLDAGAAKFLQTKIKENIQEVSKSQTVKQIKLDTKGINEDVNKNLTKIHMNKNEKELISSEKTNEEILNKNINNSEPITPAAALGPNWKCITPLHGAGCNSSVKLISEVELTNVRRASFQDAESWPIFAKLSDGTEEGIDLIICAIGVKPNIEPFIQNCDELLLAEDGAFLVDAHLKTSLLNVWAAGDCCSPLCSFLTSEEKIKQLKNQMKTFTNKELIHFHLPSNPVTSVHWHQMRLWSQARQMGVFAAHSIACSINNECAEIYDCFDMFTHVTKLFGQDLVLLGCFNGQNLNDEYELEAYLKSNQSYSKLILKNERLQGCLLIGEISMAETFENLIQNQLCLAGIKRDLLEQTVDIEDYFD